VRGLPDMGPPEGDRRTWLASWLLLAVSAAVLCWPLAGGAPDIGAALEGWDAVARHGPGWGLVETTDANYPAGTDVIARGGYPLAAALCWPLLAALGLPLGLNVATWLWLWAAGSAGAWLGGRWWGSAASGLVCGVGWQAAWAAGGPDRAAAAALMALSVGAVLLALRCRSWWWAGLSGATAAAAGIAWAPAGAVVGAALVLALAAALTEGQARAAWIAGAGAAAAALLVSAPAWGWTLTYRWLVPLAPAEALTWPPLAALVCVGVAARSLRRARRLWLLPALWLIGGGLWVGLTVGLGLPDPLRDIPRIDGSRSLLGLAALGLVVLAGGVARAGKPAGWAAAAALLLGGLLQSPLAVRAWPAVPDVSGPVAVMPWQAGSDPMVRAALGVPVVNPPAADDPVGAWLRERWPALEGPTSEAGRAQLKALGATAIVDVETGEVTPL